MHRTKKKVTMQDIADDLQVSKALVSLALSDKYGVSEDTRSKIVLRAIEMGYKFAAPKGKHNGVLFTIILRDMEMIKELFWSKIVKGIEKSMNVQHISINILMWRGSIDESEVIHNILSAKPNGVIIMNECDEAMLYVLSQLNLPVVLIDIKHHINMIYDHVYANNYGGGYEAARYLVQHGHRRLAFIGSRSFSYSFQERYAGFKDYLERHAPEGCLYEDVLGPSLPEDPIETFDARAFKALMTRENRPTALFCANDPTAFKVYEILRTLKLKIPEDVSVIGFDNVETCSSMTPPLTSINIPKEEMGEEAVSLLLKRIENPANVIKNLQLSTTIIPRDSVKPLTEIRKGM